MPRGKTHLQGIREMPGFKGFPTGGNMKSGYSVEDPNTLPQPDIARCMIMPKLNNSRRWTHPGKEMPTHQEDVALKLNAFAKNVFLYGFPQSTQNLPALSGRASNPDTAMTPNALPIPEYLDLKDAQAAAEHQALVADSGEPENRLEFIRELDNVTRMMKARTEQKKQELIEKLAKQGFSEDEVRVYLESRRSEEIKQAAKMPMTSEASAENAVRNMLSTRTGTNAAGIVPLSGVQNVSETKLAMNELAGATGLATREQLRGLRMDFYSKKGFAGFPQSNKANLAAQPRMEIHAINQLVHTTGSVAERLGLMDIVPDTVEASGGGGGNADPVLEARFSETPSSEKVMSKKGKGRPAGTPQTLEARMNISQGMLKSEKKERRKLISKGVKQMMEVD